MTPNLIEYVREVSVKSCFELSAFKTGWSVWKNEIQQILGKKYGEADLLNLGDNLSSIFKTTGKSGRGQAVVSGGGYGWEGLVCWYLNLCMIGSRAVAYRKVSDLPEALRDSISVNYGHFKSNTEADITVVVFPDLKDFTFDKDQITIQTSKDIKIPTYRRGKFNYRQVSNRLAELHFEKFQIGIIQCKTNWNDNAQIPMLWSMIYQTKQFSNPSISIGRNGFSLDQLKKFTYSFCTVPSNNLDEYKQSSTSVNRVRNLSGGNYWGHKSSNGIADSLKEIFNRNYKDAYSTNSRLTLRDSMKHLSGSLNYFDII